MNLGEVRDMYARSLSKRGRSTPPPGYTGTAFIQPTRDNPSRDPADDMESKRHTPAEYGTDSRELRWGPSPVHDEQTAEVPIPGTPSGAEKSGTSPIPAPFAELLSELRGRVGTEEVILLMVMLLLSADGAGVETLLLGLILLAGRE